MSFEMVGGNPSRGIPFMSLSSMVLEAKLEKKVKEFLE
jgi:hypothetical protein